MRGWVHRWVSVALLAGPLLALGVGTARAAAPGVDYAGTWARTDQPVAEGRVTRTWMWGPEALTDPLPEAYVESPDGVRMAQYFDKARMEITDPAGDASSPWYVTNGLLVVELLTGKMQIGNNAFATRAPAVINVAGDGDDPDGPTYATFAALRDAAPAATGATLTQRVNRAGTVIDDPSLASYGVTAARRVQVPGIDHQVASVFWDFMTSSGLVYVDGAYVTNALFTDPFYATGLPLTEAYWAAVKVGGMTRTVLTQCFERRCLTYTPGNPAGYEVEAGNVGQHYYAWRYRATGGDTTQDVTVVGVTDGNEIVVRINGRDYNVRYLGIQDPEDGECFAAEAAARNAQLVLGQTVRLEIDVTQNDWYGMMPRYVYVGDELINATLVREGYARAIDVKNDPNVRYRELLLAAEADARANERGLWGACL